MSFGFSSYACSARAHGIGAAGCTGCCRRPTSLGLLAAALAIALAVSSLRETRDEHEDQAGSMLDAGEGRTRFLALWGLWMGVVFLLAIAFNTLSAWWAGLCSG